MKVYYSAEFIAEKVKSTAEQIRRWRAGLPDDAKVVAVCALKGASVFFADLIRELDFSVELDFVRVKSYGAGHISSGTVEYTKDVETSILGKYVIIVEDIVDTGRTVRFLVDRFVERGASAVKVAALLNKVERREVEVPVDFCALEAANRYFVGYGLDDAESGRNLPDIWAVDED